MTGIVPKYQGGPVTFAVSAKVRGGRLVEADGPTVATVSEAAANSVTTLGVSLVDAIPASGVSALADDFGNSIVPMHGFPEHTTVAGPNDTVPVTYAADAGFGVLLKAAADGTVTPIDLSGTDTPDMIVGRCVEPGGVVVSTKATGLMRIGN